MKKRKRNVLACQRKKEENQNLYLPEDIIFEILTRLPSRFLHNYGRNVCQKWADLVNDPSFIESHHSRSNIGLLIQHCLSHNVRFLEVNKGNAVLKRETLDFSGIILSSCRGITLCCLSKEKFSFCIANFVTKQIIELPFAPLNPRDRILAGIGYDHFLGEFKVVCFFIDDDAYYWLFLTVGKDEAWRKVDIVSPHITIESFDNRWWISAGGVIYGVYCYWGRRNSGNIVAVDVGDETTWAVNVPDDKEETKGGFLENKNKLMYITTGRMESTISVHRLDDFRQSAWVKIYKFQLHPSAHNLIHNSYSLAWVDNGEVLLFHCYKSYKIVGFNVRTGSCKILKLIDDCVQIFVISKNLRFL